MKDRSLKIYTLVGSFVLFLMVLLWLSSKILAFYRSGDDVLLGGEVQPEVFYAKTHWSVNSAVGRVMERETLNKITQDYLAGLHYLQLHYAKPTEDYYKDYFTDKARTVVERNANHFEASPGVSSSSNLEHHLDLKLYHMNGSQVVFSDTRLNFDQVKTEDQHISSYDTSSYQVMMLLEDNKWRIRHQQRNEVLFNQFSNIKTTSSPSKFTYTRGTRFYQEGQPVAANGINYYPSQNPWHLFWTGHDRETLVSDFQLINNLGVSVVRIFIPYHEFGGAAISESYLQRLQELLDLADSMNLKVVVTLFDFFLDYDASLWSHSDRHLEAILTRFSNHPGIFAWDLKNEPDLDFELHGEQEVLNWLQFMAMRARQYDPNHMITIGWSDVKHSEKLYQELDFSSAHFYRDPQQLDRYLTDNSGLTKPFVCGEIGMHTFKSWWYPIGNTSEEQKDYYDAIIQLADKHQISYWAWTLHDFGKVPPQVAGKYPWQRKPQRRYGLIDEQGNPKPAFYSLEAHNNRN